MLIGKTMRCWRAFGMALVGLVVVAGVTVLGPRRPRLRCWPAAQVAGERRGRGPHPRPPVVPHQRRPVLRRAGVRELRLQQPADRHLDGGRAPPTSRPSSSPPVRSTGGCGPATPVDSGWTAGSFDRAPLDVHDRIREPDRQRSARATLQPARRRLGPGWQRAQSYTLQELLRHRPGLSTDQNLLRSYAGPRRRPTSCRVLRLPATCYLRVRANFPGDLQSAWSAETQPVHHRRARRRRYW